MNSFDLLHHPSFNQNPRTAVVNLINRSNDTFFDPDELVVSTPTALDDTSDHLTRISVSLVGDTGLSQSMQYHRLDLNHYTGGTGFYTLGDGQSSDADVLAAIAAAYNVTFGSTDVVIERPSTDLAEDGSYVVLVSPVSTHYIFTGTLQVHLVGADHLGLAVPTRELAGFTVSDLVNV